MIEGQHNAGRGERANQGVGARRHPRSAVDVSGSGYPEQLRIRMRDVELLLVVVASVLIAIWGIRVGLPNHNIPRGIAWGVLAVGVTDLLGYGSAIALTRANNIAQELTKPRDATTEAP